MTTVNAFRPMSKEDVADVLGVSIRTIENWVNEGNLPAPKKLGNRAYWHPDIFYAWLGRRLSDDAESVDALEGSATEPRASHATPKLQSRAATAKTELDKVRNRTQAQLDKLVDANFGDRDRPVRDRDRQSTLGRVARF